MYPVGESVFLVTFGSTRLVWALCVPGVFSCGCVRSVLHLGAMLLAGNLCSRAVGFLCITPLAWNRVHYLVFRTVEHFGLNVQALATLEVSIPSVLIFVAWVVLLWLVALSGGFRSGKPSAGTLGRDGKAGELQNVSNTFSQADHPSVHDGYLGKETEAHLTK